MTIKHPKQSMALRFLFKLGLLSNSVVAIVCATVSMLVDGIAGLSVCVCVCVWNLNLKGND